MTLTQPYRDYPLAFRASAIDPRFSFCSHLPDRRATWDGDDALLVAIHSSNREAMAFRDAFQPLCDQTGCAILAPLFPVSPFGDGNGDGYKYLAERDIRYDLILLAMVDELARQAGRRFGRFLLFGFSGGGHFAHRFLYAHPQRVVAATVAAPGSVTLLDPDQPLWDGIGGWEGVFGRPPDLDTLARVPVLLLVGDRDVAPLGHTGRNRQQQLARLDHSLRSHGLQTRMAIVPDAAHDALPMVPPACAFFAPMVAAPVR